MIDLSQAPYNIVPNWTGADSSASDWTNALEDAIGYASMKFGTSIDAGGVQGDILKLPCHGGGIMVSRPLVLPDGVVLDGGSATGCMLKFKDSLDPTKPAITLGNQDLVNGQRIASFGCALRNVTLYHMPDYTTQQYNVPLILSDNGQDTIDMLKSVRAYSTRHMTVKLVTGYGGASFVHVRDLQPTNSHPNGMAIYVDYGESTQLRMEQIEPAGGYPSGTIGMFVRGGRVTVDGFHVEKLQRGVQVALYSAKSKFRMRGGTGGPLNNAVITIDGGAPYNTGRIVLEDIERNGSVYTVEDGRSGRSAVTSDIEQATVF